MKSHFPIVPLDLAARTARMEAHPPLPLVLVVDDESLIVNTLCTILNSHGLATIPAADGDTAMDIARLAPPDVLITDVKMPGLDGFDVALAVAEVAPECSIVLLSGEPSAFDRGAEYRAEGLDFVMLIKPVHPLDLVACIFECLSLRGWMVPNMKSSRDANPSEAILFRPLAARANQGNGKHDPWSGSDAVA